NQVAVFIIEVDIHVIVFLDCNSYVYAVVPESGFSDSLQEGPVSADGSDEICLFARLHCTDADIIKYFYQVFSDSLCIFSKRVKEIDIFKLIHAYRPLTLFDCIIYMLS